MELGRILASIVVIISTGWASQYAPGVMDRVIRMRQTPGETFMTLDVDLPVVNGYVAVPECNRIGDILFIRPVGQRHWEKFLVVDCTGRDSYAWMMRNNILVEVDYETAKRWNTIGRGIRIEVGYKTTQYIPL